jgi:glutamine cyclotransferase
MMQRISIFGSLLVLFSLTACNSQDLSTGEGLPIVDSAPILAVTPTPSPRGNATPTPIPTAAPTCVVQNLNFVPSDTLTRTTSGLTEGFSMVDGTIYESTGAISGHGASVINAIDVRSGLVTKLIATPNESFGEGLVKLGNYFYQLTYTEGKIYKYTSDGTAAGTKLVGTYANPLNEGWGMTTDGTNLIASDGTAYLYTIDPTTLTVKSKVKVTDEKGNAITSLNELEYVDGQIYANIFPGSRMIRFDANIGCQTGEISLASLQKSFSCSTYPLGCEVDSVPNGIAYDANTQAFYLTGKSWPFIYKGQFQ